MSVSFDFTTIIPQFMPIIETVLALFVFIAIIKEFKEVLR